MRCRLSMEAHEVKRDTRDSILDIRWHIDDSAMFLLSTFFVLVLLPLFDLLRVDDRQ